MSGFFEDQVYKEFDWLNKAMEPITWSLLEKLNLVPEKYELTLDELIKSVNQYANTYGISKKTLVRQAICSAVDMSSEDKDSIMNHIDLITDMFKIVCDEEKPKLDLETRTISPIYLVRSTACPTDEVILKIAAKAMRQEWSRGNYEDENYSKRLLEVADIVDVDLPAKVKAVKRLWSKRDVFIQALSEKIEKGTWRIRNVDLTIKMVSWINNYTSTGNLHALANFTKLKCMMHRGEPIYSMEEIV